MVMSVPDVGNQPAGRREAAGGPACPSCWVRHFCMGLADPPAGTLERIDDLIRHSAPVPRGEFLYRAGQPCRGIHIVQNGLVRKYSLTPDGTERVLGFYIGADVLGTEALDQGYHRFNVQALDITTACLLPAEHLEEIACSLPAIFHQVLRQIAYAEIQESRGSLALQDLPADVRVAGFLLRLSQRFRARGLNNREFPLRIPRHDLANYLGLNPATVSRVIARLEKDGLLEREPHWQGLTILDPEGLSARGQGYEAFF